MLSTSKENLLKTLYKLENRETVVMAGNLAGKLNVSNAAISIMVKKLKKNGLVKHKKYRGISLTEEGGSLAKQVIRNHRLWELFLVEVLNMKLEDVHDEAELLEHNSSIGLMDKIDDFLGFPEFDPHGDPIPGKDGEMPKMKGYIPMNKAKPGKYKVKRILDDNKELLIKFKEIGLIPNNKLRILDHVEYDNSMMIRIKGENHFISPDLGAIILLKKMK